MTVFEKTRECTGRFSCRFKVMLIVFLLFVVASVATVLLAFNTG